MAKLYCLSGLGVDERAFRNLKIKGVDLIHIKWIPALLEESLEQYAKRLFDKVQPEEGYYLLGVSFGGMIATEFAKIRQPDKLYLISTIYSTSDLSWFLKTGSRLKLYRILPSGMLRRRNWILDYFFGITEKEDKKLLTEILLDTDPKFLKWALGAIAKWNNKIKPDGIVIHGSKDKLLPIRKNETSYVIEDGGHFMIVNKADQISAIIEKNRLIKL